MAPKETSVQELLDNFAMKKTWKSKRTVVRGTKTGRFAKKGWGKAYHKQRIKYHMDKLFSM